MLSAPPPYGKCNLHRSGLDNTMARTQPWRPTKFEPCMTKGLAKSIENMNTGANFVHVQFAPQVSFLYCVVMPFSYCTGVQSLVCLNENFTNSEYFTCEEPSLLLWHTHPAPLGTRYHNSTFPATVAGGPLSLNPKASKV